VRPLRIQVQLHFQRSLCNILRYFRRNNDVLQNWNEDYWSVEWTKLDRPLGCC